MEPTRNYIRALYLFGSYRLAVGDLDEAYDVLQECLANDIDDRLGAWPKQPIAVLEINKGIYDKRLPGLLRAKFGIEQNIEDIFSYGTTYVHSNHLLRKEVIKSKHLLNHAINKNPYVPLLLLRWELVEKNLA